MVLLGSEFWKKQVEFIPCSRRVLLLPHCMRNSRECPAEYDPRGLLCQNCGRCRISELKNRAESLGYTVLIAEGTPVVMQSILEGKADAILGVGCLKSLERAFEKLQLVGIPAAAVPLLTANCVDSQVDLDWVRNLIDIPFRVPSRDSESSFDKKTSGEEKNAILQPSWIHLLRAAANFCEGATFEQLIPRSWKRTAGKDESDRIFLTDRIARNYLGCGGKYFRPFITLASYDALKGSKGTQRDGPAQIESFPDAIKRIAVAIEIFHKASLVHDDIEDQDPFRYGRATLHNEYGIATAINIGDYLLGLGYRLIASQGKEWGAEGPSRVADILLKLAEAHTKLSEGQGAELFWKNAEQPRISPGEALTIYALKTAPAFEAALYAGIRSALGQSESDQRFLQRIEEPISRFARFLGIGFQIRNDLDDWDPDFSNKQIAMRDIISGRPTILWSLAISRLQGKGREELLDLHRQIKKRNSSEDDLIEVSQMADQRLLEKIRILFESAEVFSGALELITKYAERARETAEQIEHEPLKHFLRHLYDPLICVRAANTGAVVFP